MMVIVVVANGYLQKFHKFVQLESLNMT